MSTFVRSPENSRVIFSKLLKLQIDLVNPQLTKCQYKGISAITRVRKHKGHKGVCLYVGNHIRYEILTCFYNNEDRKVLWAMSRPKRLLRGYSCIIIGVVFHFLDAKSNDMLDYLRSSMEYTEANYTNYGMILLGDWQT